MFFLQLCSRIKFAINEKTAITGGFSRNSVWSRLLLYVSLPLFHRRWAGRAKVKIKVKAHGSHVFHRF
jgi:hypothetical protein